MKKLKPPKDIVHKGIRFSVYKLHWKVYQEAVYNIEDYGSNFSQVQVWFDPSSKGWVVGNGHECEKGFTRRSDAFDEAIAMKRYYVGSQLSSMRCVIRTIHALHKRLVSANPRKCRWLRRREALRKNNRPEKGPHANR